LEAQLKRAQALLKLVFPDADFDNSDLEIKIRRNLSIPLCATPSTVNWQLPTNDCYTGNDDRLDSIVKLTGQLDLDEQGNLEYHGHSSGFGLMRQMRESLGDVGLEGRGTPSIKLCLLSQVYDSPRSLSGTSWNAFFFRSGFPPKEVAMEMCNLAINDAGTLLRFVHFPTFLKQVERLYDSPNLYTNEENMFLPLFYAVLAVATLFKKNDDSYLGGYKGAIHEGQGNTSHILIASLLTYEVSNTSNNVDD
jgi:hypothetical protein